MAVLTGCGSDDGKAQEPGSEIQGPVAVTKTNSTKVYMHYMPWFETNQSNNGQWGYHWTMGNRNPNTVLPNGNRDIAAHYYPLIGPYHSGDPDVIENHLLLMKYAGVDGVLINWYGTFNLNDYAINLENSEQIIDMLDEVGLEYALVYEDRFLNDIVTAGLAPTAASAARSDVNYMKSNYFTDENYIQVNGKPLLLNFGPITLSTPQQWTIAFSTLSTPPAFFTLWNESAEAGTNATGEFAWVYQSNAALSNFYSTRMPQLQMAIGGAYPGFKDFYEEGGAGTVIGWEIPHNNGATLDETLTLAQNAGVDYLQLITWNDFGEGTMIEPTQEFGYQFVNKIKTFTGVQSANVFEDIGRLYTLRKQYQNNAQVQQKLDKAFAYFAAMQPDKAIALLDEIE